MLVEVTPQNKKNFMALAPESELLRIGKDEDYFGIGYTDDEKSLPDGVLLFSLDEEVDPNGRYHPIVDLKWLYVAKEARDMYVGTFLFAKLLDTIENSGAEAIRVDIPLNSEYNQLCSVLSYYGFHFTLSENFAFERKLSDVLKLSFINEIKDPKAVFLSDVPKDMFKAYFNKAYKDNNDRSFDLSDDPKDYAMDISTAVVSGGQLHGVFLIKEDADGALMPVMLSADKGGAAVANLIAKAAQAVRENYDMDTKVRVSPYTDRSCQLAAGFFPDLKPFINRRGYFFI